MTNKLRAFHINAFTTTPYCGNPATVIIDSTGLSKPQKQVIAREANTPETMFLGSLQKGAMRLDFFTPVKEVPSCGHGTIAAAHVATKAGLISGRKLEFQTRAGKVLIDITPSNYGLRSFTNWAFTACPVFKDVEQALGVNFDATAFIATPDQGLKRLLLPIHSHGKLKSLSPNFPELNAALSVLGLSGVFAFWANPSSSGQFYGRMFAPPLGINEDPVNGNAALALGAWARIHASLSQMIEVRQGSQLGRPGIVTVYPEKNILTGQACTVYCFDLPVPPTG